MPKRRAPYTAPDQTVIDFAPEPEPVAADAVAESQPEYTTAPGWVDTAGKTRTWVIRERNGTPLCAITTKSGAQKIADLLNRSTNQGRDLSR